MMFILLTATDCSLVTDSKLRLFNSNKR